jgi:CheY-like chemotaxis protein
VPVIALTGQSDSAAVQACFAAGMNEVMLKPVQGDALYACLARQFEQTPVLDRPSRADRSPASTPTAGMLAPVTDANLLDEKHLEELASLDLLDDSFVNGIEQIRVLTARLTAGVTALDFESTLGALSEQRRCINPRGGFIRR